MYHLLFIFSIYLFELFNKLTNFIFVSDLLFSLIFVIIEDILSGNVLERFIWLKKIIAVDLDGTLLNSESQLSDFTKQTIKKVSAKGHKIIITTGRPYRMAIDYYKELGLDTPMINFNGSLTHIPNKDWEFEQSVTLDKS